MTDEPQPAIHRRSDRVDETRIGDRLVLYHRDTGTGIVLNPAGSFIWETLATPQTTDQIVNILASRYTGVSREQVTQDVTIYVGSLKEQSLLDENK